MAVDIGADARRLWPVDLYGTVEVNEDGSMRAVVWSSQSDDWLWKSVPLAVSDFATDDDHEHADAMLRGAALLWAHEYARGSSERVATPDAVAANREHPPASRGLTTVPSHEGPTTPDDERTGTVRALLAAVESYEVALLAARPCVSPCGCLDCAVEAVRVQALSGLRAAVWRTLQP